MHDEIAVGRAEARERGPDGHATADSWFERTALLLGTFVTLGTRAHDAPAADAALDEAVAAAAAVHRLMSFHEGASDVSRINRHACGKPVRVASATAEVLRLAIEISRASDGAFDITVAPRLVAAGLLPAPTGAPSPDSKASWRDLEFVAPDLIVAHRALWIDLGGIAKGYAVDAAWLTLNARAPERCRVNAGGDLRIGAREPEPVLLDVPWHSQDEIPVLELANGSVASSGVVASSPGTGAPRRGTHGPAPQVAHVDGRTRRAVAAGTFACVVAPRCAVADALTKVVLADPALAADLLVAYDASALLHRAQGGWSSIGRAA